MSGIVDELPITDRDPADLSNKDLVTEYNNAYDITANRRVEGESLEVALDRRSDLWNEMKSRVDAEPPECPECGSQRWSQDIGEPKMCGSCGLHLGFEHMDLIEEIDSYWSRVQLLDGEIDVGDEVVADDV